MTEFLTEYGLFLAKAATVVIAVLVAVGGSIAMSVRARHKAEGELEVKSLNAEFEDMAAKLKASVLSKAEWRRAVKAQRTAEKEKKKQARLSGAAPPKRVFVLDFHGDIRATQVAELREGVTAVLAAATPHDEVLIRLESPGGQVHAYGLAASQLARIRQRNIPLTVAVDKVAASGGYLMASVADRIIAAPFAVVGSIGVLAQLPNFHRLLKKHDVDFEQITAGEHKRTLTLFGENTEKGRQKFREEVEEAHVLFKEFVKEYRPRVDIERLATGEHWYGSQALQLRLVDELRTSDDYLVEQSTKADVFAVKYEIKKTLGKRIGSLLEGSTERVLACIAHYRS